MRRAPVLTPLMVLAFIAGLSLIALFACVPKIPQPTSYHAFADTASLFEIPNWNNVWTSLIYIPLGIWGLSAARSKKHSKERILWQLLFIGVILIGIGSAIYHVQPTHFTLVIDRLPIVVVMMTFVSILIGEEKGARWGLRILPFALGVGVLSVLWWIVSEQMGAGDLRLYIWVQLLAFFAAFLFGWFRSGRCRWLLMGAAGLFALSKVLEMYDVQIYAGMCDLIGGHPLKHLASAAAVVCLILYCRLQKRV